MVHGEVDRVFEFATHLRELEAQPSQDFLFLTQSRQNIRR